MSLYKKYKTDPGLERKGVWLALDDQRVLLARAGGANEKFNKLADKMANTNQRGFRNGTIAMAEAREKMVDLYAESVILDWLVRAPEGDLDEAGDPVAEGETPDNGRWKRGVEQPDGSLAEVNTKTVKRLLMELPEVFDQIHDIATSIVAFRSELIENIIKN